MATWGTRPRPTGCAVCLEPWKRHCAKAFRRLRDCAMRMMLDTSELRFRGKFFLGLLITSYILMKVIIYLTRTIAYYFVYGVWKFF